MTSPETGSRKDWDAPEQTCQQTLPVTTALNIIPEVASPSVKASASPQHISVLASQPDLERWRRVGLEQTRASDLEIALFLISFYEEREATVSRRSACRVCRDPLPLTCPRCRDSTPPLAQRDDRTCASPLPQTGDARCLSPQPQPNSSAPESSQRGPADRDSLQAVGPHYSAANNGARLVSHPTSDSQEPPPPPPSPPDAPSRCRATPEQACAQRRVRTRAACRHGTVEGSSDVGKAWQQPQEQPVTPKTKGDRGAREEEKEESGTFQCQSCQAVFKKRHSLKKHVASTHAGGGRSFTCPLCGQRCSAQSELDSHTRAVHTLFQCPACPAAFTSDARYKAHVRGRHPGVKPHGCGMCAKAYTSRQTLALHCRREHAAVPPPKTEGVLSRDADGRYRCRSCQATFHRQGLLRVHVASHGPGAPFLCGVCGLACGDEGELLRHGASHAPFQCPVCQARFAHNSRYLAHVRQQHPRTKPYRCRHCHRAFDTRKWLAVHALTHTGERPHLCPECGQSFTEAQVLQRHRLAVHQGARAYSCAACGKRFKTSSALACHRRSHRDSPKPRACRGWDQTFPCPSTLALHKKACQTGNCRVGGETQRNDGGDQAGSSASRVGETQRNDGGDQAGSSASRVDVVVNSSVDVVINSSVDAESVRRPHVCSDCGAMFKGEQWLYRHRVSKPATCCTVRAFACKFCAKVFKGSRNLARHERVHTGEKPFACCLCPARFTARSDLQRHARTHSGVKPYACRLCQRPFRFRCDLNTHLRTHSGETPYPCPRCEAAFISASQRLHHVRTKHRAAAVAQTSVS